MTRLYKMGAQVQRSPLAARVWAASLAAVSLVFAGPAHADPPTPVTVDYASAVAAFQANMHNSVTTNLPLLAITVGLVAGVGWFMSSVKRSARG